MPPNKEDACFEVANTVDDPIPPDLPPPPPLLDLPYLAEFHSLHIPVTTEGNGDVYFQPIPSPEFFERLHISVDHQNLKELLKNVTGTDNLQEVTQVKLKIITHDICLQNLSIYTPNLRELDLNGSAVSSLRDLGCGLKNLKILRVNHCGLNGLDGTFGLQSLRELYAGNNNIQDITPCSFLPDIEVLDLRNNYISDINTVGFLSLCSNLKHIVLMGNKCLETYPEYRYTVKSMLRELESLDEKSFADDDCLFLPTILTKQEKKEENSKKSGNSSNSKNVLPPLINEKSSSFPPLSDGKSHSPKKASCDSKPHTSVPNSPTHHKTRGYETDLPKVPKSKKTSTSKLTSGPPVCGNVAAALKSRTKNKGG